MSEFFSLETGGILGGNEVEEENLRRVPGPELFELLLVLLLLPLLLQLTDSQFVGVFLSDVLLLLNDLRL